MLNQKNVLHLFQTNVPTPSLGGVWCNTILFTPTFHWFCCEPLFFLKIPLDYLPVSVPKPYSFYHHCYVIQLKFRDCNSSRSSFIVENSFSILGFLFQINFQIALPTSMKSWVGILMVIAWIHRFPWANGHFYNINPDKQGRSVIFW